jgi:hypothetical protein
MTFLSYVNVPSKSNKQNNFLKITDENSRIQIRIRILIRIPNTLTHLIVEKFVAEEGEDLRLLRGVEAEERLLLHPLRHLVGSILLHQPA